MTGDDSQRHSRADEAKLITDPKEIAEREAANGLRQYDIALRYIEQFVNSPERRFRLRPSLILDLHREALRGLSAYAGNWRPAGVTIQGSSHEPPGAHQVPELVEEMCDYVNEGLENKTPIHLSAYIMWRLNWIHPFADGNGRTSRMTSYAVLCIAAKMILPGTVTIPEQIAENRNPYFRALDAADEAFKNGRPDVGEMERLIESYLARQLLGAMDRATGKSVEATSN